LHAVQKTKRGTWVADHDAVHGSEGGGLLKVTENRHIFIQ
jgi:hypothetical protein